MTPALVCLRCSGCGQIVSAVTIHAAFEAMRAHVAYKGHHWRPTRAWRPAAEA